ncbi:hypothetical protein BCR33DRAFT_713053 [Rhizoclosmatium globosum]|uniref:Uncharacterized protein n=1 Tax=Rhizoclosmatium globosum TaxID=329046 RepID=A0A1Y2CTJ9_9FUNG|nr:hypothetical protein BCR33DRAFT_713053 [Rhizoclosmatium globosum]|eukprot:ORY50216.1 hypothetical protein BCR33DRAFT_713053 [Rhizoclosmatium globosum]
MDGNGSGPPGKPPIYQHQSNSGRTSTIPPSSRTPSQQSNYSHIIPPKRKSHGSIHSTPNSSTPLSRAPSSLAKTTNPSPAPDPSFVVTNGVSNLNLDTNEIVYPNGNRVRLRGIMPHLPADRYNYPASTNMEYGWYRKSLEIYGSTSADFAKESWKRAMETQK